MNTSLEREVDQLHAEICAGLAEPTRILILYELSGRPHNVTELSNGLGLSQPLVSRHLKVLRERVYEKAERESNAYFATSRLWDDGLLAPMDTRNALGMALSAASHAPIGEPHYGIFRL